MSHHLLYITPAGASIKKPKRPFANSAKLGTVGKGDTVWVVTCPVRGQLELVSRVEVQLCTKSRSEARRLIGHDDFREAPIYAIGRPKDATANRHIDLTPHTGRLRFQGSKPRIPKDFSHHHFRALRRLTFQSAALLDELWAPEELSIQKPPSWDGEGLNAADSGSLGALGLALHARVGRKEVFATFGIDYSPQQQHLNTGLSSQNPDGGYCIFITLDKNSLPNDAYDYPDNSSPIGFNGSPDVDEGQIIGTMSISATLALECRHLFGRKRESDSHI